MARTSVPSLALDKGLSPELVYRPVLPGGTEHRDLGRWGGEGAVVVRVVLKKGIKDANCEAVSAPEQRGRGMECGDDGAGHECGPGGPWEPRD